MPSTAHNPSRAVSVTGRSGDEVRALVDVHAAPLLRLRQPLRQLGVARRRLPQGPADPGGALVDLTDQPCGSTLPGRQRALTEHSELRPFPERDRLDVADDRHVDRGEQQLRLRPEVRIHGLHRNACDASDVSHPRPRPSVLAEELDGSVKHCRPRLRRIAAADAGIRSGVGSCLRRRAVAPSHDKPRTDL